MERASGGRGEGASAHQSMSAMSLVRRRCLSIMQHEHGDEPTRTTADRANRGYGRWTQRPTQSCRWSVGDYRAVFSATKYSRKIVVMEKPRSAFSIDSLLERKLVQSTDDVEESVDAVDSDEEEEEEGRKSETSSSKSEETTREEIAHAVIVQDTHQKHQQQQQQQAAFVAQSFANLSRFAPLFSQFQLPRWTAMGSNPLLNLVPPQFLPHHLMPNMAESMAAAANSSAAAASNRSRPVVVAPVPEAVKPPTVKKYKCDVCHKAFSRSNTLITHKRIHTGEKPFKCEHCGRAFRQPGNLTRHRLTHTTVKPYICNQCDKAFNRASNLHTHMRTHTNYRPFCCPYCGKGFHQKIDMKIHIYTHTGERQSFRSPFPPAP